MNYLVGIDIGKNSHFFSVVDNSSGEILMNPVSFKNNKESTYVIIGLKLKKKLVFKALIMTIERI